MLQTGSNGVSLAMALTSIAEEEFGCSNATGARNRI